MPPQTPLAPGRVTSWLLRATRGSDRDESVLRALGGAGLEGPRMTRGAERAHLRAAGVVAEGDPADGAARDSPCEDRIGHGLWIDGVLRVEEELSE